MKSPGSSSAPSPRRYTLGKRATGAQSTRDEILTAAKKLVSLHGFTNLTVDAVAQEARVSRLTVYNHFVSKAGLLEALAWSIFASADIDRVRQARLHPDIDLALRTFVSENVEFLATIGDQGRAVLAAALSDPELGAVMDATYVAGRRAAITELVGRIEKAGRLRPGWTQGRAVAAVMVITALESYDTLARHTGWSTADAGELLGEMAAVILDTWQPPPEVR